MNLNWVGVLVIFLTACHPAAEPNDHTSTVQSAMEVKRAVEPIALQPLSSSKPAEGNAAISIAFANRLSDVWVHGHGVVAKLLPDDHHGARHQRFIVQLPDRLTLLIAHNIDLAPRLDGINVGDAVKFKGEYIYNPQGGIIHWTHHDPKGSGLSGWIEYQGKRYE